MRQGQRLVLDDDLSRGQRMSSLSMNRAVVGQASRPRIRRGRDARDDSRDGCPTTAPSLFMVLMRANYGVGALHERTRPRLLPGGEQGVVRALRVPLPGGVRGGFMVTMHAEKTKWG